MELYCWMQHTKHNELALVCSEKSLFSGLGCACIHLLYLKLSNLSASCFRKNENLLGIIKGEKAEGWEETVIFTL